MGFQKRKNEFVLTLLVFWISNVSFSQDVKLGERRGLIQTTSTIYPVVELNGKGSYLYASGYANYFFEKKYSARGELFQYLAPIQKSAYIKGNTQILIGIFRYFPIKRFDAYVGLQTRLSIIKINGYGRESYNGILAVKAGFNYHVWQYIYLYLDFQYMRQADPWKKGSIDLLAGSFGLGIQMPGRTVWINKLKKSNLPLPLGKMAD